MRLFVPQSRLEEWMASDKADIREGRLVVTGAPGGHPVQPALHFSKLVSGTDDKRLVGRVKTMGQLDVLGAEHLMDSVLLGETAYEVVPGYLAEVTEGQARPGPQARASNEADLLAAFILDKL